VLGYTGVVLRSMRAMHALLSLCPDVCLEFGPRRQLQHKASTCMFTAALKGKRSVPALPATHCCADLPGSMGAPAAS
jgi:hypothetical protein